MQGGGGRRGEGGGGSDGGLPDRITSRGLPAGYCPNSPFAVTASAAVLAAALSMQFMLRFERPRQTHDRTAFLPPPL